jgi:hypothetical protein
MGAHLPTTRLKQFLSALATSLAILAACGISSANAASPNAHITVSADVLPSPQIAAEQSTVHVVAPDGSKRVMQLSPEEKQALTSRPGFVPTWLQNRISATVADRGADTKVIEIQF